MDDSEIRIMALIALGCVLYAFWTLYRLNTEASATLPYCPRPHATEDELHERARTVNARIREESKSVIREAFSEVLAEREARA